MDARDAGVDEPEARDRAHAAHNGLGGGRLARFLLRLGHAHDGCVVRADSHAAVVGRPVEPHDGLLLDKKVHFLASFVEEPGLGRVVDARDGEFRHRRGVLEVPRDCLGLEQRIRFGVNENGLDGVVLEHDGGHFAIKLFPREPGSFARLVGNETERELVALVRDAPAQNVPDRHKVGERRAGAVVQHDVPEIDAGVRFFCSQERIAAHLRDGRGLDAAAEVWADG